MPKPRYRTLERSQELLARAYRVIPAATQTWSKHESQWPDGASPAFLKSGKGAHVWDVDGNEWIDYSMALAPILIGYAEPAIDSAIRSQLEDGIVFPRGNPLEVTVAEQIVAMVPGVEAVRFSKGGSDAVSAAVRAARAITGRDHIASAGHHGWHDWFIGSTAFHAGVPDATRSLISTFAFNDLDGLRQCLETNSGRVAAVVLEPSGTEVPAPGFLESAVALAHEEGALVIFDEVVTGFRLAPGGARQRYGVLPDFSCYGKALGNGMPISAIGGPWEVMRAFEEIFHSTTHGGEALSLAAASAVLTMIADGGVLADIEGRGTRLRDGLTALVRDHGVDDSVRVSGEPQRPVVSFPDDTDEVRRSWVHQCFALHGILFNGSTPVCARHSDEDIERGLEAFDYALRPIAAGENLAPKLVGRPLRAVYRSR